MVDARSKEGVDASPNVKFPSRTNVFRTCLLLLRLLGVFAPFAVLVLLERLVTQFDPALDSLTLLLENGTGGREVLAAIPTCALPDMPSLRL